MKKPELLAPVGNMAAFYAAIEAGCDAVYLAGYAFGARAYADNFSNEEIVSCINYAHIYGVKVYVTVNTIIYEKDVDVFMEYVEFLHKNNVDAIIIQDLGMFDLIRKTFPNLEIHISTQMHIHNPSGAVLMHNLGAKRVVLSREVSIDTIKEIKKCTDVELEVFVHGALCFSYSGQCYMSSIIGGRSGNQGKCAGTCRLKYSLVDSDNNKYNEHDYPLSMKDLCTIDKIGELIDLGIDSFKVEGRMKRPEYVFLVISLYRRAIDNYILNGKVDINEDDLKELKKIYNREFTKGYLFNKTDVVNSYRPNHLGIKVGEVINKKNNSIYIKLNDDITRGDGLRFLNKTEDSGLILTKMFKNGDDIKSAHKGDTIVIKDKIDCFIGSSVIKTTDKVQMDNINSRLSKKIRKVMLEGKVEIKCDNYIKVIIGNIIYESTFKVEKAISKALTSDEVKKQFMKTNDTPYMFSSLEIDIDNSSFIPVSKLNEVRRLALEEVTKQRLYVIPFIKNEYDIKIMDYPHYERKNAFIRTEEIYNVLKNKDYYNIYMKKSLYEKVDDPRKILRLERVTNINNGGTGILVSELGSITKGCITDFNFNIVNSYAVAFLHSLGVNRITLSIEMQDDDIEELINAYKQRYNKNPNLELIVYGREELMLTKYDLCKVNKQLYLKDRFNNKMPIVKNDNGFTIYNYSPKSLLNIDKYYKMGINYLRYDFIFKEDIL